MSKLEVAAVNFTEVQLNLYSGTVKPPETLLKVC